MLKFRDYHGVLGGMQTITIVHFFSLTELPMGAEVYLIQFISNTHINWRCKVHMNLI